MGLHQKTLLPLGLLALGLVATACIEPPPNNRGTPNGTVVTPAGNGDTPDTDPNSLTEDAMALSGEGIQVVDPETGSTTLLAFGSAMPLVQNTVTQIYGTPEESAFNEECPGGPLTITTWANGLALNAAEDEFVGWSVRPTPASATLTTMAGVGLGSTRSELEAAYTADVFESSLGVEFSTGQLSGLLTSMEPDGVITNLWAGLVCIFR
jgi:hypothetical protein